MICPLEFKPGILIRMIFLLLIVGCGGVENQNFQVVQNGAEKQNTHVVPYYIEAEEYEIFSLMIKPMANLSLSHECVILNSTIENPLQGQSSADYVYREVPEITEYLYTDFLARNQESFPLEFSSKEYMGCLLVNMKEFKDINSGIKISISRVGFNSERNQALVYTGWVVGFGEGGEGNLVFLEKVNGDWVIIKSIQIWVS